MDAQSATFLISIIGITNTVGRVLSGILADLPWVNPLWLNNFCIICSGLCVFLTPFAYSYTSFVTLSLFFGFFVCEYKMCVCLLFICVVVVVVYSIFSPIDVSYFIFNIIFYLFSFSPIDICYFIFIIIFDLFNFFPYRYILFHFHYHCLFIKFFPL